MGGEAVSSFSNGVSSFRIVMMIPFPVPKAMSRLPAATLLVDFPCYLPGRAT
jgi:hypothetical protein